MPCCDDVMFGGSEDDEDRCEACKKRSVAISAYWREISQLSKANIIKEIRDRKTEEWDIALADKKSKVYKYVNGEEFSKECDEPGCKVKTTSYWNGDKLNCVHHVNLQLRKYHKYRKYLKQFTTSELNGYGIFNLKM